MRIRIIRGLALIILVLGVSALSVRLVKAEESVYDVNGDGKVDIQDLREVSKAFASHPGDPNWNPRVDFNNDSKIDLSDYGLVASHFGDAPRLLVVPEYWMGTILGLAGCFAAFGLFRATRYKRQ